MNITIFGAGYVGLSISVLLAQHHKVTLVDIIPEKIEMVNKRQSPIQDNEIEEYLATKALDLTATLDVETACQSTEFFVVGELQKQVPVLKRAGILHE